MKRGCRAVFPGGACGRRPALPNKVPMHRLSLPFLLLASLPAFGEDAPAVAPTVHDFSSTAGQTPFAFRRRGKAVEKPELKNGRLQMLFGRAGHKTSIGFERTATGAHRRIDARFTLSLKGQNEGACFALLRTGRFNHKGLVWDPQPPRKTPPELLATPDWAEPNLKDSLAVGFDVKNPKDEEWFNENGNYYGRPEREVSLHFDGVERANVLCPTELATGEPVAVRVLVEFVAGGAEVTVTVGESTVYDRHFLAHVLPYESRVGFGAHGTGEAFLDDVSVKFEKPAVHTPPPIRVEAIRRGWLYPRHGTETREVDLLPAEIAAERVVATITYRPPMARDFWDRNSAVYVWDDAGTRFEIAYEVDVSNFAPLLFGRRKMAVMVGSNVARGFLVDVDLTYYRKSDDLPPRPRALGVQNLWSGTAHFNKKDHIKNFFAPRTIKVPDGAKRALVRICVSGHGVMEFTELGRALTVNGEEFRGKLWKTDCYLNPYRPQFGTWKFDRAGWQPGGIVEPWVIDVSHLLAAGTLKIEYAPDAFEAKKWASHWVEAQIVFLK